MEFKTKIKNLTQLQNKYEKIHNLQTTQIQFTISKRTKINLERKKSKRK